MSILDSVTQRVLRLILPATALLVPLFFLPLTADLFAPHKQTIILLLAAISLLTFSLKLLIHKKVQLTISPVLLPLFLLIVAFILSALIQSPNPYLGLTGITSTIIALFIIFFTTTSSINKSSVITTTLNSLLAAVTISAIVAILQFLNLPQRLFSAGFLASNTFNPTGGPLPLLTLTLPLLPVAIVLGLRSTRPLSKILYLGSAIVTLIASVIAISLLLPQANSPRLIVLPLSTGWNIAIDTFKNPRTAIFGVGPNNFAAAFTQFKPLAFNLTQLWNTRFQSSSNYFLHLLTTTGLLGLGLYLLVIFRTFSTYLRQPSHSSENTVLKLSFIITLFLQLLIPINLTLLTLTFILLALISLDQKLSHHSIKDVILSIFALTTIESQPLNHTTTKTQNSILLSLIFFILSLALIAFTGYYHTRAYLAEIVFFRSLEAAAQNNGTATYNLQIQAINLNPREPRYRLSYSQTNLALANSIASSGSLSDQDRSNITQLVQQAIREAKAATALSPQDSNSWANLAVIYRQLINLAQGADQWSIAAYSQAIALNPLDPQLRLELGGVHYSLGNYEQAIVHFQEATSAKPDLANAYYNLAAAYRQNGQLELAYQALQTVLKLVDPASTDYQNAQTELADLEQLLSERQGTTPESTDTQAPTELITPTPLPSPTIEPIELPDESGLNITPTPTPEEPLPTPTPTP